jgi:hypothetical protein
MEKKNAVLLLACVMAACSRSTVAAPQQAISTRIETPISSTLPIPSYTPTSIPKTSRPGLPDCIKPEIQQGNPDVDGALLVRTADQMVSIWNPRSSLRKEVGKGEIAAGIFSNVVRLAFLDYDLRKIKILSPNGDVQYSHSIPDTWHAIIDWADRHHLWISNMPRRADGGWDPPSSTVYFDTENGNYKNFPPEYPDIDLLIAGDPWVGKYSYALAAYDPGMTRAVYPASTSNDEYIILWDLLHRKEIIRIQSPHNYADYHWNADGSFFITSAPSYARPIFWSEKEKNSTAIPNTTGWDVFRISRFGEVEKLTSLVDTNRSLMEWGFSVSPDNRKVGFWVTRGRFNSEWYLGVLEMDTGALSTYCIVEEGSYPIYWSADSRQLITTITLHDWETHKLLWVDTEEMRSVEWAIGNSGLFGWINNNYS